MEASHNSKLFYGLQQHPPLNMTNALYSQLGICSQALLARMPTPSPFTLWPHTYPFTQKFRKLLRISEFRTLALNTRKQNYLKGMQQSRPKAKYRYAESQSGLPSVLSTSFFSALILFCLHLGIHVLHRDGNTLYREQVSHFVNPLL